MNETSTASIKSRTYSMLAAIQNEQSLIFINQAVRALFLKEPMAEGDQGALGYYRQEIEACAQQITDAGTLKRIYLLAHRLLGKQKEACPEPPPTEPISPREADMANLLRYAEGLTDRHLHLTAVAARTYAAIEYEAGQEPAEPRSWVDKACALLPKLTPKDQEGIYWMIERQVTCGIDVAKIGHKDDGAAGALKALVNDEMAGVVKPKTLDAILSYARIARQREGRE